MNPIETLNSSLCIFIILSPIKYINMGKETLKRNIIRVSHKFENKKEMQLSFPLLNLFLLRVRMGACWGENSGWPKKGTDQRYDFQGIRPIPGLNFQPLSEIRILKKERQGSFFILLQSMFVNYAYLDLGDFNRMCTTIMWTLTSKELENTEWGRSGITPSDTSRILIFLIFFKRNMDLEAT